MKSQRIKANESGQLAGLKPGADYFLLESAGVQMDDHAPAGGPVGVQRHVISFTANETSADGETIVGNVSVVVAAEAAPVPAGTPTLGQGTPNDKVAKPKAPAAKPAEPAK